MLLDHANVRRSDSLLTLSGLVGVSLLVLLDGGGGTGGTSGSSGAGSLLGSHSLGLSLSHPLGGVVVLELAEADELVAVVARDEHIGVVDHEDESISLLDGDAGDSGELLHSELGQGLAGLLLASVKLGTLYKYGIRARLANESDFGVPKKCSAAK